MIIAFILIIYFLPSIVGAYRHKRNSAAIFILNFFLGWTLIGWIIALIWAASYEEKTHVIHKDTFNISEDSEPNHSDVYTGRILFVVFILLVTMCSFVVTDKSNKSTNNTRTDNHPTISNKIKNQNIDSSTTPLHSKSQTIKEDIFLDAQFIQNPNDPLDIRLAGSTNLPDETLIFASLYRKESGWFDVSKLIIKNGKFYSDPLIGLKRRSYPNILNKSNVEPEPLSSGAYSVHFIMTYPSAQAASVREKIGNLGEFLNGPLIIYPLKDNSSNCPECEKLKNVDFSTMISLIGDESEQEDNRVANQGIREIIAIYNSGTASAGGRDGFIQEIEKCLEFGYTNKSGKCYAEYLAKSRIRNCYESSLSKSNKDDFYSNCIKYLN